jgi:NADH:ubiquinone oxidoreductase subunit 4 (subunit M)
MLPNEWVGAAILVVTLFYVGLYPAPFVDMIQASVLPIVEQVRGVK